VEVSTALGIRPETFIKNFRNQRTQTRSGS
jgi:hypothetical protein